MFEKLKKFSENDPGDVEENYNQWSEENHGRIEIIERKIISTNDSKTIIIIFYKEKKDYKIIIGPTELEQETINFLSKDLSFHTFPGNNTKIRNALNDLGIKNLAMVVKRERHYMLKARNFGKKSFDDLERYLSTNGCYIGMPLPEGFAEEQ